MRNIILSLLLVTGVALGHAETEYYDAPVNIGGCYYSLSTQGHAAFRGFASTVPSTLVIPETLTYGDSTYTVTSIGTYYETRDLATVVEDRPAIFGEANLRSVTIPLTVTSIADGNFCGCVNLTTINTGREAASAPGGFVQDGDWFVEVNSASGTSTLRTYLGTSATGEMTIGAECTPNLRILYKTKIVLGEGALYGRSGVTSIVFSSTGDFVNAFSFAGMENLASVTSEASSSHTFSNGFIYADSYKTLVFACPKAPSLSSGTFTPAATLTAIDMGAFFGNPVKKVNLGSSSPGKNVVTIGTRAFAHSGLTEFVVDRADIDYRGYETFQGCTSLATVDFGGTEVIMGMFRDCTKLTSVTLQKTERISQGGFFGCTGLKTITLPTTLSYIGSYAFAYCTGLSKVCSPTQNYALPNSLTKMLNYVFSHTGITKLFIPKMENPIDIWRSFHNMGSTGIYITIDNDNWADSQLWGDIPFGADNNYTFIITSASPKGAPSHWGRMIVPQTTISYYKLNGKGTTPESLVNFTFNNEENTIYLGQANTTAAYGITSWGTGTFVDAQGNTYVSEQMQLTTYVKFAEQPTLPGGKFTAHYCLGSEGWEASTTWTIETTGIEDVRSGATPSCPAEYYDLTGRQVKAPQTGRVYIVRRGPAVTKELYR